MFKVPFGIRHSAFLIPHFFSVRPGISIILVVSCNSDSLNKSVGDLTNVQFPILIRGDDSFEGASPSDEIWELGIGN